MFCLCFWCGVGWLIFLLGFLLFNVRVVLCVVV